jgi:hypothetical protein
LTGRWGQHDTKHKKRSPWNKLRVYAGAEITSGLPFGSFTDAGYKSLNTFLFQEKNGFS